MDLSGFTGFKMNPMMMSTMNDMNDMMRSTMNDMNDMMSSNVENSIIYGMMITDSKAKEIFTYSEFSGLYDEDEMGDEDIDYLMISLDIWINLLI